MTNTSDPIFGVHAHALTVNRQRLELLAGNIANADTPGYRARDLDFRTALADAQPNGIRPASTHAGHLSGAGGASVPVATFERQPLQPSVDGNTVDIHREQADFAEATLRYRASLDFADGRLRSLLTAITGGR